jgi:hypothetical protein
MAVEKLPTSGQRSTDSSTNSVRPDVGKTAREGSAQGDAGNRAFREGFERQSGNRQPGNSPYNPQ